MKVLGLTCVVLLLLGGCRKSENSDVRALRSPGAVDSPGASGDPIAGGSGDNDGPGSRNPDGSAKDVPPTFDPTRTPTPYNKVEGNEKVTWEQLTAWWPYRPLLRFDPQKPPKPGGSETFWVSSKKGGLKGDPRKEFTTASVFFEVPPNTTDRVDYFGVLDTGGVILTARFYPPSVPFDKANIGGKLIVIRGFPARMTELRKDLPPEEENEWRSNATDNVRFIQWQQDGPNKNGVIDWLIVTDPTIFTEQQAIDLANSLRDVN